MPENEVLFLLSQDPTVPVLPEGIDIERLMQGKDPPKGVDISDLPAYDSYFMANALARALRDRGYMTSQAVIKGAAIGTALKNYSPNEWIVFNLVEQLAGKTKRQVEVPEFLKDKGYKYTGSDAATLAIALDKAEVKKRLMWARIATPKFKVFTEAGSYHLDFPYPAFVKPAGEDASIGIDDDSVVHNDGELKRQVRRVMKEVGGAVLVEEFIDGREFNVAIIGNGRGARTLPLAEINFGGISQLDKKIITFNGKWDPRSQNYQETPVICPANVEKKLADEIRGLALFAYALLHVRGYGRVDIRVKDDKPYILEVNPNCGIAPDAGFPRQAKAGGYDYPDMAELIMNLARGRKNLTLG